MSIFLVTDRLLLLGDNWTTYKTFNDYSSAQKYVLERLETYKKYKYFFDEEGKTKEGIEHICIEHNNAVTAPANTIIYSVDIYEKDWYDDASISINIIKMEVE